MAFFKFKKDEQHKTKPVSVPESVDVLKARARNRLVGAVLLVLIAFVGFPLLFNQQRRPLPADLPIIIPDKTPSNVAPDVSRTTASRTVSQTQSSLADTAVTGPSVRMPATQQHPTATTVAPLPPAPTITSQVVIAPRYRTAKYDQQPASSSGDKLDASTPLVPVPTHKSTEFSDKPTQTTTPHKQMESAAGGESAKIQAILDGKAGNLPATMIAPEKVQGGKDFILQVGAFATQAKAQEVQLKLEHAGIKTYMQEIKTSEGERIRVRVGPFTNEHDAKNVMKKIHQLGLAVSLQAN